MKLPHLAYGAALLVPLALAAQRGEMARLAEVRSRFRGQRAFETVAYVDRFVR